MGAIAMDMVTAGVTRAMVVLMGSSNMANLRERGSMASPLGASSRNGSDHGMDPGKISWSVQDLSL